MSARLSRRFVLLSTVLVLLSIITSFAIVRLAFFEPEPPKTRLERLYQSKELIGKSKEEVISMLGKPNQLDPKADTYYFLIGKEKGLMQIDDMWLVLRFRDDRVASQVIQSD